MTSYRLPNSPEKENLIQYLQKKKEECSQKSYENSGTQEISWEERVWLEKESVYREILEMIR